VDRGLFCPKAKGFLARAPVRLQAPRVGRLRARAKPELGRIGPFGFFLCLAELVKLFYFNSELDLYI
jgi:hypothetical protein